MDEISERIDREYFYVTLLLPEVLHDWFLEALEDGRLDPETGYEDYISQLFLEALHRRDTGIRTPELLLWEIKRFDREEPDDPFG